MAATATDARPGSKATVRYLRMSASKVRVVLDLVRGKRVGEAIEILTFSERLAAAEVLKCLNSAIANAEHNEDIPEDQLYVSECFADQGPSLRRFRPRARGRAGRIHKQTCHLTVAVSRLTDEEMEALAERDQRRSASPSRSAKSSGSAGGDRARRVAKSKAAAAKTDDADDTPVEESAVDETAADNTAADNTAAEETATEETAAQTTAADDTTAEQAAADETANEGAPDTEVADDEQSAGDQGEEE